MARRGYGEGSIFPDRARGGYIDDAGKAHGPFIVRVRYDGGRRATRAKTITDARSKLIEIRNEIQSSGSAGDGNRTVVQLCDEWEAKVLEGRNHSPATRDVYRWALAHLTDELGRRRVRRLTADDVERAFERLAADGKSRASLVKIRSVLGQVLTFGERRGVVNRNVARMAELPASARRPAPGRALTVDEARRLLEVADRDRLAALWATMLLLGLRPGEATGLSWSDVDMRHHRIHVRRSVKFNKGTVTLDESLKTSRSRRTLDAPKPVVDRLQVHRRHQAEERLKAGRLWSSDWPNLTFTTVVGTPISPSNLRRAFAKISEEAGLGRWHPHELRHSAASILSVAGVPLERVADVLGHDGTRMTALVYRHAVGPSVTDAAPVMDDLFG